MLPGVNGKTGRTWRLVIVLLHFMDGYYDSFMTRNWKRVAKKRREYEWAAPEGVFHAEPAFAWWLIVGWTVEEPPRFIVVPSAGNGVLQKVKLSQKLAIVSLLY